MTRPSHRLTSLLAAPLVAALMAAPTTMAAPEDFSDDFNDGLLAVSYLLQYDDDGNPLTPVVMEPRSVFTPIFGSSTALSASAVQVKENRRRGELQFRSRRTRDTNSFAGYFANGWTFDPLDPLDAPSAGVGTGGIFDGPDSPGTGGATITLLERELEAIDRDGDPLRIAGLPDTFIFNVEMFLGLRTLNSNPNPFTGAPPRRGLAIALVAGGAESIGYSGPSEDGLLANGLEIALEDNGSGQILLIVRQYTNGVVSGVPLNVAPIPAGEAFDGIMQVRYYNNRARNPDQSAAQLNSLEIEIVTRRGINQEFVVANALTRFGPNTALDPLEFTGACCFGTAGCVDAVLPSVCESAGGEFSGRESVCASGSCEVDQMAMPGVGACCFFDAAPGDPICMELTNIDCLNAGGIFQGDGIGCVGTCETGPTGAGDDGVDEQVLLEGVPRYSLFIGGYSVRSGAQFNPNRTFFDAFEMIEMNFQLDGNQSFGIADPDINNDGFVTAADLAAALDAFPPASDDLLFEIITTIDENRAALDPGFQRISPEFYLRDRQYNRAIGRFYKREVIDLFAGQRDRKEKRADRRRLQDVRFRTINPRPFDE